MTCHLEIKRFAYHTVDRAASHPGWIEREPDLSQLDPTIVGFLLEMVAKIWDAEDAGSTCSARFYKGHPQYGSSLARPFIEEICNDAPDFIGTSKKLAQLLHENTHPRASAGVLVVLRLVNPETNAPYTALIKVRHKDESFVRLMEGDVPSLEVEKVQKMLLKEIQKGSLIPHPEKPDYDLKVIDVQASDEPAKYFTQGFLGCEVKKSDEHQATRLWQVIQAYAEKLGVVLLPNKVPELYRALRSQPGNITTSILGDVAGKLDVFGPAYNRNDFIQFIESGDLGRLDIPPIRFQGTAQKPRRACYQFKDPKYQDTTLVVPVEILNNILDVHGQQVRFIIETTRTGFEFRYE